MSQLTEAKQLAKEAGLIPWDEATQPQRELIEWFQASIEPLMEAGLCDRLDATAAGTEAASTEAYYDRRRKRTSTMLRRQHEMRGIFPRFERTTEVWSDGHMHNVILDESMPRVAEAEEVRQGLWEYRWEGKLYRSWFSDQPLMEPRQIAGFLRSKHGDVDVHIVCKGMANTQSGGYHLVGGREVPHYEVFLTPALPGWIRTAENLYLQHGKLLDKEQAQVLHNQLQTGQITRETYADKIAELCRTAPVDPDTKPTVWLQLNENGSIDEWEIDDTRDVPDNREPLTVMYDEPCYRLNDADEWVESTVLKRAKAPCCYDWEGSDEELAEHINKATMWEMSQMFGFTEDDEPPRCDFAISEPDMTEDLEIGMLLGLKSEDIDKAVLNMEEGHTALDLVANVRRRKALVSHSEMIVQF